MNYKIREYIHRDFENCVNVFKSNIPKYFMDEEVPGFENFLNKKIIKFVIEVDGIVVGLGSFGKLKQKQMILWGGIIHRDYQKRGLGKALLEYRIVRCKNEININEIIINTSQLAQKFYEKYGFKVTEIKKGFYRNGENSIDAVAMSFILK